MFEVRLKPGHPTGVYHRAGLEFTASAPVRMESVLQVIRKDPWLEVTKMEEEKSKGRGGGGQQTQSKGKRNAGQEESTKE